MGFDNECILNIQSLAGEYFCPVCRTLVYPHEALQTQCTHLYCKPCLSYIVSSTQACPYDGYLVTEAGSKPLIESNKALAETIGKTIVHCLYHRSGCVWQGPLSECTTHCTGCAFGNSPVVCNRCGIQIVHRQVQEHAQTCNANGTNTQPQGSGTAQNAATSGVVSTDQSKIAPAASQPTVSQNLNQPATTNLVPQAISAPAMVTPEQQYYQQYQQYYQQYPGYDPYQQAYQQYYPYQQQPAQQVQPPAQHVQQANVQPQLQQQVQPPMPQVLPHAQNHPISQAQSQGQGQGQPQPQTHPQAQSQIPVNAQPQPLYPQAVVVGSSQNQGQMNLQPQGQSGGPAVAHAHMPSQSYSQIQPQLVQSHAQLPTQAPQYPQPHPQVQPPQMQLYPQNQPQAQPQPQPQPQPYQQPPPQPHYQPPALPQSQLQPTNPQHPPGGHPSYPSQPHQHIQHAPPQQNPMQVQPQPPSGSLPPQFPPPPPHMRPPQPPNMFPPQQRPAMHQVQQSMPPQYTQQPQLFPGQTPGQPQGQPHHTGLYPHQHLQVHPQAPPQPMPQPSLGFVQPQQGNALPHSMPPQSYVGRPAMMNQGGQPPQYPQSAGPAGVAPPVRPPQFGPDQQHNQYAPPAVGEQMFERRVEPQENKSPLKKSEQVINDFGEVKPEAHLNDELKSEDGRRKDEALIKDTVSELHQIQGDSGITQRVKEESKGGDLADHSQSHHGPFSQSQTPSQGSEQSPHLALVTEQRKSLHPPVPYGLPGQQQRPVAPMLQSSPTTEPTMGQSSSHSKPPVHGYLSHGPHPGEQFLPLGPSQPRPVHPEVPPGGPNSYANISRNYEPQSAGHGRISRLSQGDPLGPPPPHGPDSQLDPRHPGPMESDMYQNQRPPHSDNRHQDSHLPGNSGRGHYGSEPNSLRMNGVTPPGLDMPPARHREEAFKPFHGPPHMGRENSPNFRSHMSRPSSGYGMDGPPRFYDKDPHGYGYDAGPYHLNESGGRPLPASVHDNRGGFDNNPHNPDFHGPMHGFGRRHVDRFPPTSPRNPFGGPHNMNVDGRNMERQPFGERFPMGPPGHMHRGEFDGPGKSMNGEPFGPRNGRGDPGFGSFHDYGRSGELNRIGGFSRHPRFGEPFGPKSTRPHLDEPDFRGGYSRQGFPSDGGSFAGGFDSFDPIRKNGSFSMGWCRICKLDCGSVEGLEVHGQTREHQRMSMDMVISIKKNAKRQKSSIDREEAGKFRNS